MSEKSKPLTTAERARQKKATFLRALGKWKVFLETTPPEYSTEDSRFSDLRFVKPDFLSIF